MEIWVNHLPKNLEDFDVEVLCYDIKIIIGDENAKQVTLNEIKITQKSLAYIPLKQQNYRYG